MFGLFKIFILQHTVIYINHQNTVFSAEMNTESGDTLHYIISKQVQKCRGAATTSLVGDVRQDTLVA
jgi:hypothetical protein